MGIINLWGILILNSCLHGFQKLNCYNHVFKNYLQVFELDQKFVTIWKIKLKYLKTSEIFLWVFFFFFFLKHLNIDVVNILVFFLVSGMCFIAYIIPNLKKWHNFWRYFWGIFSSPNDMTQIVSKSLKDTRDACGKKKSFVCFEMLEEGYKFERLFFWCFEVENKVTIIYKIFCLHPPMGQM